MLIVALDPPSNADVLSWVEERFKTLKQYVQGFKIGLPAIIEIGLGPLARIFRGYSGLLIADLKLADIGDVMSIVAERLAMHGFNAVIAHAFIGYEQALDKLSAVCREKGLKLILVVSMSHKGSREFIDRHVKEFVELAKSVDAWGVVAPATRPEIIRFVRELAGKELRILSPGIGVQGAEPGTAICSGADYEIVGRVITYSSNVLESAFKVLEEQRKRATQCLGLR